jgi:hypothetical protein
MDPALALASVGPSALQTRTQFGQESAMLETSIFVRAHRLVIVAVLWSIFR